MLNRLPFFGTNSILLQIRLVAACIALSSLFIVFVVVQESSSSSEILDEHFRLVAADRHIAEFERVTVNVQSLSMALTSTGNTGSDVIDHQIELFAEINNAEVLATKVSNLGPEYAGAIHPYKFGAVLQDIASQVLAIRSPGNYEANKPVIARLEETTVLLTERISKLAKQTAQRSLDSRKRMGQALFKALVIILVACCLNLLACFFLAQHLVRRVADPAKQIAQTTEDLANGNLDIEVPDSNLLELKAIASALEKFRESAHRENRLAFEDPVSRLPNRRAFLNKLNEKIDDPDADLILVYIDVDHFKDINDGYGHTTGDTLVKTVGERLNQIVAHHDIIARVGGDEFAILITCDADNTPEAIGKTIINTMHEPLCCDESKVTITLSVGIAMTGLERSASALMQEADIALYHAKESGRDQFSIYSTSMAVEKNLIRHLERDLPQATHADQMRMVYQPIINISNPDAQELEALIRWEHPELVPIQPDVFIGVAERSGFINLLGIWILERVYSDMQAWPDARVSINLSPIQLKSKDFVQDVLEIGRRFGISPHRIEFEITESMDIENSERAILTLGLLRSYGFRIALDDFGTGYSSLSFIKNYPLDRIKLDRSLLEGAGAGGIADAVLGAALTLGSRMKLEVVAEGVEEINQVEQMKEAGCSHLQGYYFSKPLERAQVHGYLSASGASVKEADIRKNAA